MASSKELRILQITKPEIVLDQIKHDDLENSTNNKYNLGKMWGFVFPLIKINGKMYTDSDIDFFQLNVSGFLPTITLTVVDLHNQFKNRNFPMAGAVISVFIRGAGDDKIFKPIRIDFDTVSITPFGGVPGKGTMFRMTGKMRVPNLFKDTCGYFSGTSFETLLEISKKMQLGFSSNVTGTSDSMNWINPTDTTARFVQDITSSAYLDEDSFFGSYIDPYYLLNFVELNRLYQDTADIEQSFNFSASDVSSYVKNVEDSQGEANVLTNHPEMRGTARYLDAYNSYNNTSKITTDHGYFRFEQHYDVDNKEYVNEFVDPFATDDPNKVTLKGRGVGFYDKGSQAVPEFSFKQRDFKTKYLGKQGSNMHPQFNYSIILNYQNQLEIQKYGLVVTLNAVNPALHRFQRIFVIIYDFGRSQTSTMDEELNKTQNREPSEGAQSTNYKTGNSGEFGEQTQSLNQALSGFYVISEISYKYDSTISSNISMELVLSRRDLIASP
jgi:hypothetical protein